MDPIELKWGNIVTELEKVELNLSGMHFIGNKCHLYISTLDKIVNFFSSSRKFGNKNLSSLI